MSPRVLIFLHSHTRQNGRKYGEIMSEHGEFLSHRAAKHQTIESTRCSTPRNDGVHQKTRVSSVATAATFGYRLEIKYYRTAL